MPQPSADGVRVHYGVPVHLPEGARAPDGLVEAALGYEAALMSDDLTTLEGYFAPGDATLRGDEGGLLVGRDTITRFRGRRGGAPKRVIEALHVRPIGDHHAWVAAVTAPLAGGRGLVTQLWERQEGAWRITAAHVSAPPRALDPRVWRVVGEPLLRASASGPLDGLTFAVKDVFAVEGFPIGAGVPAYLEGARPEPRSAASLRALLAEGASVRGIAQTDQFAYSIAGRNAAYGTPPNPAVPGAISGGSSSGPAAAVAMGHATIGLATDTAGSIRIPASYQGLWGLRTTHGAVSTEGVLPLAPSFDTVGWLTRDGETLAAAARASLDPASQLRVGARLVTAAALAESATPEVARSFARAVDALAASGSDISELDDPAFGGEALDALYAAFRTVQASEAWAAHGAWIQAHPGALGADVAARFEWAAAITPEAASDARVRLEAARRALDAALGDAVLVLPSAASVAPAVDADGAEIEAIRAATLRMTAVAGATGRPAVSVPGLTADGAPIGVCFVGPRASDVALVDAAIGWSEQLKHA
ncbi:AtzH-like domain-containing protein [Agromyces albus]|uniref:AtzH-like domain-containing protein n=1 Tax=Agromyces albus TaxID=205332 RepID=UPI00277E5DD6|nr:AtzH-like domain-containing protein [Agromyces albus]MDQ0576177.1 amidase [Agromyces albus]